MGMPRFVSLLAAVSVLVSCATRATTSEPTVEVQPVATVAPVASVATMTEATTTTTEPTTTTTETVGRQAQRWKGATFNAVLGRWNTFVDSYIAHLEEGDLVSARLDCVETLAELPTWIPDAAPKAPDDPRIVALFDELMATIGESLTLCSVAETLGDLADATDVMKELPVIVERIRERIDELGRQ